MTKVKAMTEAKTMTSPMSNAGKLGVPVRVMLVRLAFLMCFGSPALPANADGLARVEQSIFGMDCAPCAYGVEQGIRKLPGGADVAVSLNEGTATITFAANSPTTLENIRKVIRNNGFTPKAASVTLIGKLVRADGATWLETSNLPRYRITGSTAAVDEALRAASLSEPKESFPRLPASRARSRSAGLSAEQRQCRAMQIREPRLALWES